MSSDEDAAKKVLDRILGNEYVIVDKDMNELTARMRYEDDAMHFVVTKSGTVFGIKRISSNVVFPMKCNPPNVTPGHRLTLNDLSEFL